MAEPTTRAPGSTIVRASVAGAAVLVATSLAGALDPDGGGAIHAGVSVGCFVAGTGLMVWAYLVGLSRSRTHLVSIPGLFFGAGGAAPRPTRRVLQGALAAQVVAVVVAASVRPYTQVAFGVLAPMLGLGLMALWGARHGRFPDRAAARVSRPPHDDGRECSDG